MPRVIRIKFDPPAGLGNNMLHYLLARVLQDVVPQATLVGDGLPDWTVEPPGLRQESVGEDKSDREIIDLYGHVIPFSYAIERLRASNNIEVRTRSLAMRMEYFGSHLHLARKIFPPRSAPGTGFGDDHIVFVVRTGAIYRGVHPNYTLLPISFYRHIINETGLRPAFIGQIEDNEYCRALRDIFPTAPFCHGSPMDDFHMIRTSSRIVLAVSTFAWLAAWLSETAKEIIFPILGLFNPNDRPDIDILPVRDDRYQYFQFPGERWTGSAEEIAAKISGAGNFNRIISAPSLMA